MIAAVKGWYAAWAALLVFGPLGAKAADGAMSAAKELAAKTSAFAGAGAAVTVTWRNTSSLSSTDAGQARTLLETALQQAGERIAETGGLELRVTLSESPTQYLFIEEARRGDERQVWIAGWTRREGGTRHGASGVALDRRLVWEQGEQILDLAFSPTAMLVLSPSNLTVYNKSGGQWQLRQSFPITPAKPWPRDLRGRLRIAVSSFQAFLPGMTCNGTADPLPVMECRASDEPWVLESGSRGLLLANFVTSRNYFDGRVVSQNGTPRTVAPFYTAASVEERGQTLWLLALVDGRVQIFDSSLTPVSGAAIPAWGSDIAGIDARCGPPSQVLATRPGDGTEPDAVQGFTITDRTPQAVTAPVSFPGPVTALWSFGGNSALAVARDLSTGRYSAYVLTVACGS